jgi:hypothetical protein
MLRRHDLPMRGAILNATAPPSLPELRDFSVSNGAGLHDRLRGLDLGSLRGCLGLTTPILLLSRRTCASGKPIFSQIASIAHQRLFF